MALNLKNELKRLERAKHLVDELEGLGFNVNVEIGTAPQPPQVNRRKGLGERFRQIQKTYWAEVHRISSSENVSVSEARVLYRSRKAQATNAG